jgi:Xaa-Pro aminopeptidase
MPWQESDDPVALVAGILGRVSTVALDDRMWAEKVLAFRAAMSHARQVLAGPVLRQLRMRKSTAEVQALRSAGAAIDRVHAQMAQWLRVGRTEAAVD